MFTLIFPEQGCPVVLNTYMSPMLGVGILSGRNPSREGRIHSNSLASLSDSGSVGDASRARKTVRTGSKGTAVAVEISKKQSNVAQHLNGAQPSAWL